MQIGFVGLGKMGSNMVRRLLKHRQRIVAFDINERARQAIKKYKVSLVNSLEELAEKLKPPRKVWVMVPAGKPTEKTITSLSKILEKGDIIIEGGNSYYKDSIRRALFLKKKGIEFLDAGVSGGIRGLREGYCLMVGGKKEAFLKLEPIFKALAPEEGYLYTGKSGSGHFVKMVHNGIEYALLEAYAEGFEIMQAKKEFKLNFSQIARVWNRGSIIRSFLLELCESIFKEKRELEKIKGYVEDSGEGRWTVLEAVDEAIPAGAIMISLLKRFRSREKEAFSDKVIAALRNKFGGHKVKK